MNAKLLFTATVALALASSFAMAGENQPLTRAEVVGAYQQARANGTLLQHDYQFDRIDATKPSTRTRAEVVAEMGRRDPLLVGETAQDRNYNPYGSEILRMASTPRAEVKAEVLAAQYNGTLRHSDYENVPVLTARRNVNRSTAPILARSTVVPGAGS